MILEYLIVCPLVFIAGFIDAVAITIVICDVIAFFIGI